MLHKLSKKITFGLTLALLLTIALVGWALAAELFTAEVTGTPNDVTVLQGSSSVPVTINVSATGSISSGITSANPSLAKIDTAFTFLSGTLTSSGQSSSLPFYSSGSGCSGQNCGVGWNGAPTPYAVTVNVSANAATPAGNYTIPLYSDNNTTEVTNPSAAGGKLADETATNITVHVRLAAPSGLNATGASQTQINLTWTDNGTGEDGFVIESSDNSSGPFTPIGTAAANATSFNDSDLSCGTTRYYRLKATKTTPTGLNSDYSNVVSGTTEGCTPIDSTPPDIDYTLTPASPDGSNGWYKSNVTLTWTVTEDESPSSLVKNGCANQNITADQAETTYSCSATSDGGSAGPVDVSIKRDATAPTITGSAAPPANGNDWNNTDVVVSFTCGDNLSGVATCGPDQTLSTEGSGQSATGNAVDNAGNSASATVSGINIDKTAPTATANRTPGPNANGWNNTDVTVSFSGNDGSGSGIDFCDADVVLSSEGAGQSASGTCTDKAGNTSAAATASGINIDKTAPGITWNGSINDGDSFYFGSVPAAPTCMSTDSLSGPNDCGVTGYGTTVGSHTLTATAHDVADNSKVETRTYTVLAWTLNGFYQPVDMGGVWNTVKGGSTVPLKFEVFAGSTELTDTAIVSTLTKQVACNAGSEDTVEVTATGGTSLRYDTVAGQFVYNWQTPKLTGKCYVVTMTTQDGSSISANFKLK